MDDKGNTRPWFDDGRTGWVKTGVTINDMELIEELPIMDFRNKSIPADSITSTDANKSIQRSLTKRVPVTDWAYISTREKIFLKKKRRKKQKTG